ncbi:hypothetical protein BD410DRAFT_181498 [Rickenella mellea]|uniref:Uncharacterized protein n=1 Tax=Rickenella mellea TaxID=50990 RepID=A0A4Y7PHZ0_9AGAM|nr:hypothetical protein BD410DRAFT_181498 [Rickenella mellea]
MAPSIEQIGEAIQAISNECVTPMLNGGFGGIIFKEDPSFLLLNNTYRDTTQKFYDATAQKNKDLIKEVVDALPPLRKNFETLINDELIYRIREISRVCSFEAVKAKVNAPGVRILPEQKTQYPKDAKDYAAELAKLRISKERKELKLLLGNFIELKKNVNL